MKAKEIYKIWAPVEAKWSMWVRPVPFIPIDNLDSQESISNFCIPDLRFDNENFENTAIIVDLPGYSSIEMGLAFIKYGLRPIPSYNGVVEQKKSISTTDNISVSAGLVIGASVIEKSQIDLNANPVFLIDSNRTNRYKMNASIFDNSWDIYGQDIPSYSYLKNNNINRIIVICNRFQRDLRKVLYKFQKNGVEVFTSDGYSIPKKVKVRRALKDIFDNEI